MTRFLFTQEPQLIVRLSYSRWGNRKSTATPIFISTAESVPAGTDSAVEIKIGVAVDFRFPQRTAEEAEEAVAREQTVLVDGFLAPTWSWRDTPELWSGKHKTTGFNGQAISNLRH